MPVTSRTLVGLVASSVLLSGCSVLKAAVSPPQQSVADACAVLDSKRLSAAGKALDKAASGSFEPKAAAKAFDSFTTVLEAAITKVDNTEVKTRAQLASIAARNFAAELRTFKSDQTHLRNLKDDLESVKKQTTKLQKLCGWA
ncbi:MAG: hypothetical protein KDB60_19105 [Propionibacteriaceae bacterium]|nr:hypothetical protein [Propionibacteriaceae bacterium]